MGAGLSTTIVAAIQWSLCLVFVLGSRNLVGSMASRFKYYLNSLTIIIAHET